MSLLLPLELVDIIIDHLWDDNASLTVCSAVCGAWLKTSRLHLFRAVTISSRHDTDRITSFLRFLQSPSGDPLRQLIQFLVIQGMPSLTLSGTASSTSGEYYDAINYSTMFKILKLASNVQTIVLRNIAVVHPSDGVPPEDKGVLNPRRVALDTVNIGEWFITPFLSSFRDIKVLHLSQLNASENHALVTGIPQNYPLREPCDLQVQTVSCLLDLDTSALHTVEHQHALHCNLRTIEIVLVTMRYAAADIQQLQRVLDSSKLCNIEGLLLNLSTLPVEYDVSQCT